MKGIHNSCKNMFEVALKWILKCYFLVLSSYEHSPAVPSKAFPSLLAAERKSLSHSDLKICLSSDSLDLSEIISTKHFLPFSFFPPSFLPEEYSPGQCRKERYNLAQQSEFWYFCISVHL